MIVSARDRATLLCEQKLTEKYFFGIFFSLWAQPQGPVQTEAEGGRKEEQPNAKKKRWKHHDSLQEEGSGANGYAT